MEAIEHTRIKVSKLTEAKHKSELGQFFTPLTIAKFMASLFPNKKSDECILLDAGAGIGSLSDAFLERCLTKELEFKKIKIEAYEIDNILRPFLEDTLNKYVHKLNFDYQIKSEDFIEAAVNSIQFNSLQAYTHAILNPPYLKINSLSNYRSLLRYVGIETVNLYSAFVALSVLLMRDGGQIVTIIPRSFCNGPYYKTFRKFILSKCAIRQIHLFESRNSAFKDDQVLQENVILYLEVGRIQADVKVSVSTDDNFCDYSSVFYPFEAIVKKEDSESFIHIPSSKNEANDQGIFFAHYKLSEIGLFISTGPIVDFRLKNHLRANPEKNASPLIYPAHFTNGQVEWPKNIKKPNAIMRNSETEKWFFQNGFYCVVRRFSSKEEKRRIVACLVDPSKFQGEQYIGFENHLNVFHIEKHGMPEELAKGLVLYLNTSIVDKYFRQFSGHTQVNAADLKLIKYPSRDALIELGKYYNKVAYDQNMIDEIVRKVCE